MDPFLIPLFEVHSEGKSQQSPALCLHGIAPRSTGLSTNLERKHPRCSVIPPLDYIAFTHNEPIPREPPSEGLPPARREIRPSSYLPELRSPSSSPGELTTRPGELHLPHPSPKIKSPAAQVQGFHFNLLFTLRWTRQSFRFAIPSHR